MTIYVGNLNFQAREEQLTELFSQFGEVQSVKLIKDNFTGKSKGFAFVEMADEAAANEAIEALNESEFLERTIVVNKAKPKEKYDRPRGGEGVNRFNNDRVGDRNNDRKGYNKNYNY